MISSWRPIAQCRLQASSWELAGMLNRSATSICSNGDSVRPHQKKRTRRRLGCEIEYHNCKMKRTGEYRA